MGKCSMQTKRMVKPKFFCFSFCQLLFFPNECPGLCRHRPGHSLGKKKYFLTHCALGDANGEVLNADEEDGETEAL